MTPEQLMGEVRGCMPRMVQEVEARLEKASSTVFFLTV